MQNIDLHQRIAHVVRTTAQAWGLPARPVRTSRAHRSRRSAQRQCVPVFLFAV